MLDFVKWRKIDCDANMPLLKKKMEGIREKNNLSKSFREKNNLRKSFGVYQY